MLIHGLHLWIIIFIEDLVSKMTYAQKYLNELVRKNKGQK